MARHRHWTRGQAFVRTHSSGRAKRSFCRRRQSTQGSIRKSSQRNKLYLKTRSECWFTIGRKTSRSVSSQRKPILCRWCSWPWKKRTKRSTKKWFRSTYTRPPWLCNFMTSRSFAKSTWCHVLSSRGSAMTALSNSAWMNPCSSRCWISAGECPSRLLNSDLPRFPRKVSQQGYSSWSNAQRILTVSHLMSRRNTITNTLTCALGHQKTVFTWDLFMLTMPQTTLLFCTKGHSR